MPNIENENQQVYDAGDLRKYRIELPNLYDDADLDPYEFRLLAHYKRVGTCWESTATTAAKCKMSVGKVSEARRSLQDKGFINIQDEPSDYGTIQITVKDVWAQNFEKYAQRSHSEHDRSPHERRRSPHETKKEPIEESTHAENQKDVKAQCWNELVEVYVMLSGGHYDSFAQVWEKYPDKRRHDYAIARARSANPRKFSFYLSDYLGFDPDKPATWGASAKQYPQKREQFNRPASGGRGWDEMRILE